MYFCVPPCGAVTRWYTDFWRFPLNISFLLLFPHPGAISPMGAMSPMGAISRMITISRLLLSLFGFVRHKTQIQPTTIAAAQRARYSQHPCRAQQQQAAPCACRRYALYSVELFCRIRGPSPVTSTVSLLELYSAAAATLVKFRQQYYYYCCMG